nr:hypothetical protein [Tanacetum cinerariifolium]
MTSFGYRLNPRFAIKECLSCGALYTEDCSCSKGNIEDKILVPKPLENCARCAKCGHPDHGVKSSQNPPPVDKCCCECAHAAWVKGQKEVVVFMLLTMDLEIQLNLAHLGAYDMLRELKVCIPNKLNRNSCRLGEYMSQEFLDHLKEHEIIAHHTPPYTRQNNGVSERRNRTLLDMVRSMMSQTTLPKSFGDYALETVARILNMVPTKKVNKTPYELAYIEKILKRYYMENSKRGTIPIQEKLKLSKSQGASTPTEKQRMQNIPYASAIGSIMYDARCTRPDVAFAQNMTSRFQQNPGEEQWTAVKNILKYLRNTKDMFPVYRGNMEQELSVSCYTDAGYLTDADNLKSQIGYVFVLNGGAVDWKSTKQRIFATSSTDAEYIAAFDASKEAIWIRKFIYGLGIVLTIKEPIRMYCDNTRAIAIAKDDGVTKGARHFRAKVHYLRETIKLDDVKIEMINTYDNSADPFTKALAFPKHSELTRNIGLLPASSFM